MYYLSFVNVVSMKSIFVRTAAMVIHILLNAIAINYFVGFDPSGSWLRFGLFTVAALVLLMLFVAHLITYIAFLKSR